MASNRMGCISIVLSLAIVFSHIGDFRGQEPSPLPQRSDVEGYDAGSTDCLPDDIPAAKAERRIAKPDPSLAKTKSDLNDQDQLRPDAEAPEGLPSRLQDAGENTAPSLVVPIANRTGLYIGNRRVAVLAKTDLLVVQQRHDDWLWVEYRPAIPEPVRGWVRASDTTPVLTSGFKAGGKAKTYAESVDFKRFPPYETARLAAHNKLRKGLTADACATFEDVLASPVTKAAGELRPWLVREYAAACLAAGDTSKAHRILVDEWNSARTAESVQPLRDETKWLRLALQVDVANLTHLMGDPFAETFLDDVLETHESCGAVATLDYASALHNRALLHESQGEKEMARRLLERELAITLAVAGSDSLEAIHSQSTLALFCTREGEFDAARSLFARCLPKMKAARGERDPLYAQTLSNYGYLLLKEGNLAESEKILTEALKLRRDLFGENHIDYLDSLRDLADVYCANENPTDALPLLKQVNQIAQQFTSISSFAQSERQQLALAGKVGGHMDRLLSVAIATRTDAEPIYNLLLSRKGAVFARQRSQRLCRTDPNYREHFDQMRVVCSELSAQVLSPPDAADQVAWKSRMKELHQKREELERLLAKSRGGSAANQSKSDRKMQPSLEVLRSMLQNDAVLLDFFEFDALTDSDQGSVERRLAVFVVRPHSALQLIDLGATAPIQAALSDWLSLSTRGRPVERDDDPAIVLRKCLWAPLEPLLTGSKVIYISPDGITGRIPFLALPSKDHQRYLIEDYRLSIVPVPQLLESRSSPSQKIPRLIAVGAVDFDAAASSVAPKLKTHSISRGKLLREWEALPGTRAEVVAIRDSFESAFPEGESTLLRGDAATEDRFIHVAETATFLHLATHGFFLPTKNEIVPQQTTISWGGLGGSGVVTQLHPGILSGLVLAGANAKQVEPRADGILTSMEVAELDLTGVQLATLSACETSLGEAAAAESLIGLQRAFQMAGAKTTIGSLWKVSDFSTQQLMVEFYENMWIRKLSATEALRRAQLSLLNDTKRGLRREAGEKPQEGRRKPPMHWAAFMVSSGYLEPEYSQ